MNNVHKPTCESVLMKAVQREDEFLSLLVDVQNEIQEKWDFVKAIELAKTNIPHFNNETIHKMKMLGII